MVKNYVKKQSFDYELIAMSFHEAGHAVCGIFNYIQVFNVHVMTDPKKRNGLTEFFVYEKDSWQDEDLKKIIAICELQAIYAGLIAEKMYYKDICGSSKFPMHLRIGSSSDMQHASSIIRKNKLSKPGKNTLLFKKQTQYDVELVLNEHWDAVKIVAHSLYKKKRLTFDELKFLLTRKTVHKSLWKDRFKKIKIIHNEKKYPKEEMVKDLLMEDAIFSI
jgi:hypothetical protein